MIKIMYGQGYSDDTWEYVITTDCRTVGDFINEVLRDHKGEWGCFRIYESKRASLLGNPRCEYRYGEIVGEPLPQEYLSKEIKGVSGSGGWSCSDYTFVV